MPDRGVGERADDARRARFEALVPPLLEPLRRFLTRRADAATRDDVLSETLLVLWRRLDEAPEDDVLPWAYAVARNCLANADRSARRQQRVAARIAVVDPPQETSAEAGPRDDAVDEALATLPVADAELLRLSAWEQLKPAEIAVVLGLSANAASIRLHRARGKLREALRKIEGTAGHEESQEGRGS